MVKFRRSIKSDASKSEKVLSHDLGRPHHVAQKSAPLKVIKALFDYEAPTEPNFYLSFLAGDYLHVIGRENDSEWYEACNPIQGTRGLVPVSFFEQVGKTVRDSRGSESTSTRGSGNHDSGYGTNPSGSPERFRLSRMTARSAAPVYGIVAYDFKAERPDELDAKEGEAIIVIAQSNPEWFVAKPITRLGGPGLIPVSFIEIKDMQTGQTISDAAAAVVRAGIPRVEEWKKMAAEYKNTSIPLGQIGATIPSGSVDGLPQGMDRMSLGSGQASYGHSRTGSSFSHAPSQYPLAPLHAAVPRHLYADDKFHFVVEVTLTDNTHWDLTRIYEDFYELQINLIKAFPEEAGNTGHPRTLPLMPGPVQFVTERITEGRRENLDEYLYRLLQLGPHIANSALVRGFFSPRGNDYECDVSQLGEEHSRSAYAPGGDRYDSPSNDRYSSASIASIAATASAAASVNQAAQPGMDGHRGSNTPLGAAYAPPSQHHQRGQSSLSTSRTPMAQQPGNQHYRTPSDATFATSNTTHTLAPPISRNMTQTSTGSSSSAAGGGQTSSAALKVKVWFDRDTCVVLRLPPRGTFTYPDLHRKIMERRRLEFKRGNSAGGEAEQQDQGEQDEEALEREEQSLWIEYRDEITGEYMPLENDASLAVAVERCEKLTLVVRAAG